MNDLDRILALLDGPLAERHVLVVGDVMLDRYIWGDVDRISPEAPVPVLRHTHRTQVAGGAANVAANLTGLGIHAVLAGFWGHDAEQAELSTLLLAANVDASGMVASAMPTISKTRIVARRQQMLRLDIERTEGHTPQERSALHDRALALAANADAIVLSDYAKGVLTRDFCQALIAAGRKRGIPVLVDPKDRDFTKYSGATTICPNLAELAHATGMVAPATNAPDSAPADNAALFARAQQLVRECNLDFLTVTLSECGIMLIRADSQFHSPARAREVFDVSGAGDTVIATLAAALAGGLDAEAAVHLANIAAGIVVGKIGTAPIDRNELVADLTQSATVGAHEKVLHRERLRLRAAEWRATGQRLVFTNGCFDLLHVGHITLLEKCRDFGDKLIVGINSDASVQRLKGAQRPLVKEADRARILAALAATDAITIFDEDTPLELLRALRPDVLVKGGDYSEATVVGAPDVRSWGGRVEIVPTVVGFSTTAIVNKMTAPNC
jgi:D-beta-D-heptose 7-phosphate kinase/D-beta-D-heptose 1-phosphate adenosyltransferase